MNTSEINQSRRNFIKLGSCALVAGSLKGQQILGANEDLAEIIKGQDKQLADWGVSEPEYYAGRTIHIDPKKRTILSPDVAANLTGPHYRKGFELHSLT